MASLSELSIISFNCKGFKPRNYDYINKLFVLSDILLLQETWLYDFEDKLIKSKIPNSVVNCISSMNSEDVGRGGRPYGGLAILTHNKFSFMIKPIKTNSNRILAIELVNDNVKILLIDIYFPNDDGTISSYNEVGEILDEVSGLKNIYINHEFLMAGDFNIDFNRRSINCELMKQFLNYESLYCSEFSSNCNNEFTYESWNGSRSIIDHFVLNSFFKNCIIKSEIIIDGLNLSDHNAILLKVDITTHKYNKAGCYNKKKKSIINWKKAKVEHVTQYKYNLDDLLSNVIIDSSVVNCAEFNCTNHENQIMDLLNNVVDIMKLSAELSIPRNNINNKNKRNGLPGWNEIVKPFRDRSIFWSNLWKDSGCPINNEVDRCRKYARVQYHKAIKFIKTNEDKIISNNVSNTLCNNNFIEFWSQIRRIKGINKNIPSVVDNKHNENDINKIFFDKYNKLYNSYNDKDSFNQYIKNKGLDNIRDCSTGKCKSHHKVDIMDTIKAIKKLKKDKNDYIYELSSDYLINGTNKLYGILAIIYNLMFSHSVTNLKFNSSIIKPIPKDVKKSLNDSNNYRAIALSTIFSKVFEYIMIDKIYKSINVNDSQFGYKNNLSTNLCTFMTLQTVEYYKNNNSNVFILYLDASKAFDLVKYDKLFNCLKEQNICPLIMRMLITMYKFNNLNIEWGSKTSENIPMTNGVKQGGILSPILFNIYLMPLFTNIQNSGVGCYMGDCPAMIYGYADDIVILAPTIHALRKLILLCEKYSEEFNLKFNADKSMIMCFINERINIDRSNINVHLNGKKLQMGDLYKHLGIEISNKNSLIDFTSIIKDMKIKCNVIMKEFASQNMNTRIKLFNSHCLSLYGCPLWDLQSKNINTIEIAWRKCARYVLGVPSRTHNNLLPYLIKSNDILTTIHKRMINFFIKGLSHDNEKVKFVFNQCLLENYSYIKRNINIIIDKNNLQYNQLLINKRINIIGNNDENWLLNILNELLSMRENKFFDFLSQSEINYLIFCLCTD